MQNIKTDILTLYRVSEIIENLTGIKNIDFGSDEVDAMLRILINNAENINRIAEIVSVESLTGHTSSYAQKIVSDYFDIINFEMHKYADEIEKRKQHCRDVGEYIDPTQEEILEKNKESENVYKQNFFFSIFIELQKNNIDVFRLSISECLFIFESIICDDINKSTYEMLAYIESENKDFCNKAKNSIKNSMFYDFSIDINTLVSKVYSDIMEKKTKEEGA